MTVAEQQLARLGFTVEPRELPCWRTTRLDGPVFSESRDRSFAQPRVDAVARAARAQSPAFALPHLPHRGLTLPGSAPRRLECGQRDQPERGDLPQHRREMRRRRAAEPFEPVLIEERGQRRLAKRRFPQNAEQRGGRLLGVAFRRDTTGRARPSRARSCPGRDRARNPAGAGARLAGARAGRAGNARSRAG